MNHDLESMYMEVEIQNTHIDMMLITEENKSTEFLYCLSLKNFPVEISIFMRRNFLYFLSIRRNAF